MAIHRMLFRKSSLFQKMRPSIMAAAAVASVPTISAMASAVMNGCMRGALCTDRAAHQRAGRSIGLESGGRPQPRGARRGDARGIWSRSERYCGANPSAGGGSGHERTVRPHGTGSSRGRAGGAAGCQEGRLTRPPQWRRLNGGGRCRRAERRGPDGAEGWRIGRLVLFGRGGCGEMLNGSGTEGPYRPRLWRQSLELPLLVSTQCRLADRIGRRTRNAAPREPNQHEGERDQKRANA